MCLCLLAVETLTVCFINLSFSSIIDTQTTALDHQHPPPNQRLWGKEKGYELHMHMHVHSAGFATKFDCVVKFSANYLPYKACRRRTGWLEGYLVCKQISIARKHHRHTFGGFCERAMEKLDLHSGILQRHSGVAGNIAFILIKILLPEFWGFYLGIGFYLFRAKRVWSCQKHIKGRELIPISSITRRDI